MNFHRHLFLNEITLPPSSEWMDSSPGWRFVRISAGLTYWLGHAAAKELAEGDLVVVSPKAEGSLRASQLGEARLHYFHFCPELLSGFLTLSERHYLETTATQTKSSLRVFSAAHEAAREFAAVLAPPAAVNNLFQRCRMLQVVATVFADEMLRHQPPMTKSASAQHRFKQLIQEMPDNELINHSPEQLAQLCGCSLRHFSRLFRKSFGTTIRSKQTELRLLKARQLLSDTDAKIINVALDSGYRHLGLFNAMFKKYLGMTPSEWRQKNSKKPRPQKISRGAALLMIAVLPVGTLHAAEAQGAPADGATNAARPAVATTATANTNNSPVFEVKGYEITGNTLFSYDDMEPIFKKYVGQAISFETIRQALSEFQMAYRQRGFVTVNVNLPQQQLTNGLVKVKVTEGRLTQIEVINNRHFSSNNVMRALPSLSTNIILNSLTFQQDLDRANANRDRQIYPVISPGPDPGTTALTLKVKDRIPLHGRFELDNFSTPNTPELRMNVAAQYNNLWQADHQIGLQYNFTPTQMKAEDQMPRFWDQPLIASYSAFYRVPLAMGNAPADLNPKIADFGYDEATKRFRPPPARGHADLLFYGSRSDSDTSLLLQSSTLNPPTIPPDGGLQVSDRIFNQTLTVNEDIGGRFVTPLPTFWDIVSSLSAGLDYKKYSSQSIQDRVIAATVYTPEIIGMPGPPFTVLSQIDDSSTRSVSSGVFYLPFAVNWDASRQDKTGVTIFNFYNSFNFSGLFGNEQDFERVALSTKANGNYYVALVGLTREQKIIGDWTVRLHADGQWANQPLISTEQFALGGNPGVRGYRDGQQYGDTGWRVSFEPRTPLFNLGMVDATEPMFMRLFAFVDYGQSNLIDSGPLRDAHVPMLGTGFGLTSSIGEHFDFRFTFGIPVLETPGVTAGVPRLTFAVGAQF